MRPIPIRLTIETIEEVRVDWDGKSDLTAEDLNARECAHGNDTHEAQSGLDQAREFLREVLTDGPLSVEDLLAAAEQAGIKRRTLDRAKDKEGVRSRRVPTPDTPATNGHGNGITPPQEDTGSRLPRAVYSRFGNLGNLEINN